MTTLSENPVNPLTVFISSFLLSGFAALASVLRSGKALSWMVALSSFLNSGLFGLAVALVWYTKFQDNIYFPKECCIIAGLQVQLLSISR